MVLRIGLSQRVDTIENYGERRDSLDQNWARLIERCGHVPVPIINTAAQPDRLVAALGIDAVILTGGNDIADLPGASNPAPERDATERAAIGYARQRGLPLLAVCRGFQMLNYVSGGRLASADGHVGRRHRLDRAFGGLSEVNSYHGWAIPHDGLAAGFTALACAPDGTIEAASVNGLPWLGVMWHPEREMHEIDRHVDLIRATLKGRAEAVVAP